MAGTLAVGGQGRRAVPPLWLAAPLHLLLLGLTAWLRLDVFAGHFVPLAFGLPLLLSLWDRNTRLMFASAAILTTIAFYKTLWLMPGHFPDGRYLGLSLAMQMIDIWLVGFIIHRLLRIRLRLEKKRKRLEHLNADLEAANADLTTANNELAHREEEISRQNEELQCQTEEMERQAEELRQQTEEMAQQSAELQELNAEMVRRERAMQTLLESARWMRSDLDEAVVLSAICHAAVQVMGEDVKAAAILEESQGKVCLRGHWGFGVNGALERDLPFDRSFAGLIIEKGQTAFIEDVHTRPDLELPQPVAGRPFRSLLTSPVWMEARPVAVLEVYSQKPRQWNEEQFRAIEWLAAQCGLALQAMHWQQELELRRRDAEEASVQKTRFLAAVSHDVRTPANAISLLADLIRQTARSPERSREVAEMAEDLKSNARALVELVSDVLDLARFDAGRLDLQVTEFSLAALIQAEVKQAMPLAQAKGLYLWASLPERAVWVRADRMKLARVLSNLIGNALKFTETGEVEVRCELMADGRVELHVIDTGVGISPEHLPRVFDEFFQLRNPERDRSKGTGLGLAICRRLVDGLGCSLAVHSTVGQGTTFTIHLPAELIVSLEHAGDPARNLHRPPTGNPDHAPKGSLHGLRILLVEDHDVTRAAVAELLSGSGAVVSQARTGREALHLMACGQHHVLLLDLMLPDIDGNEILKSIQVERPAGLRCILAVSGDVRAARIDEVKRLGADDLIPKPLSIDQLIDAIQKHASRRPVEPGRALEMQPRLNASADSLPG